jgi:NSS family neurotransmitter:Na+ symporter
VAEITKSQHGEWSSRFAFILAATGSAVGLGNIWKFPYITGENGGGAFVLVYLLCIVAIGIPIMIAETMLGRRGRQSPINTMATLADEAKANKNWHYVGWMGIIAGFLILSYYSVIAGWVLSYVFKAFIGSFSGGNVETISALFTKLMASPLQQIFWHTVFLGATMLIVARGVQGGLEKSVRFLMPTLFILLVLLVGYAMTTGYYQQGFSFLFKPDFSQIDGDAILVAMGHAFFTLGLGMGAIMVYGSYLPKNISIVKTTLIVAGADTVVALLAGLAIFPLVFANGLEAGAGPGLIFQSLPLAFGNMTGGWLFGLLFFVLLFFAALSSSISLIEPAVAFLVENKNMKRVNACVVMGLMTWFFGVIVALSFNIWSKITFFGKGIFDLLDYLTANLMLPIGGLCIAIFTGWIMKSSDSEHELELEKPQYYGLWKFLISYIAPAAVIIVLLKGIGVIG